MDRESETRREYSERKARELEEKRRKYKPGYACDCRHKFDICYCDETCKEEGVGDHTLKVNDALEDE